MDKLKPKELKFVRAYTSGGSARAAAKAAGYDPSMATHLMQRPRVKKRLARTVANSKRQAINVLCRELMYAKDWDRRVRAAEALLSAIANDPLRPEESHREQAEETRRMIRQEARRLASSIEGAATRSTKTDTEAGSAPTADETGMEQAIREAKERHQPELADERDELHGPDNTDSDAAQLRRRMGLDRLGRDPSANRQDRALGVPTD